MEDESIFINMGRDDFNLRALAGGMMVERSGSRICVAVYGAVVYDGIRLMRTCDASNAANFVGSPELARRRRGKVMVITNNAPPHKQKKVRRYPTGTRVSCCCTCQRPGWR